MQFGIWVFLGVSGWRGQRGRLAGRRPPRCTDAAASLCSATITQLNHQRYILLLRALSAVTKQISLEVITPQAGRACMLPASAVNSHHFRMKPGQPLNPSQHSLPGTHCKPARVGAGEDTSCHPCCKSSFFFFSCCKSSWQATPV